MIQEVLFALAGHPGDAILETEKGFEVAENVTYLSLAERGLIAHTVRAGFHCMRLTSFCEAVRRRHVSGMTDRDVIGDDEVDIGSIESAGHYIYGLALSIEAALDGYLGRLVELEAQLLREPSLPLAHLASAVEEDRRPLLVLHRLVDRVCDERLAAGALLDVLWATAASHVGSSTVSDALWAAMWGAGQALANQLVSWLVYGRLVDPCQEFFIRRADDSRPPWRPGSCWCGDPVDDFTVELDAAMAQREWRSVFFVTTDLVPCHIVSFSTARKVLFVGKAVRVLLRSGCWPAAGGGRVLHDNEIAGVSPEDVAREKEELQVEVNALRTCFEAKSPSSVVERSVERIRSRVASRLRTLLIEEAKLLEHIANLKGFYLLGFGNFYQTFLEEALPILQRTPTFHAEADLKHGAWATAMAERERSEGADTFENDDIDSFRFGVAHTKRRPGSSRFSLRFVPHQFELLSFADAARQVRLVGSARLAGGHAELGLGQWISAGRGGAGGGTSTSTMSGSSCQEPQSPAMLWLSARQRVASSFEHAFSFQVHAPPYSVHLRQGYQAEYGSRFALCFQHRFPPASLQRWRQLQHSWTSPSALLWSSLVECLALEVTYCAVPPGPADDASAPLLAEVTISLYVLYPGLGDGQRPDQGDGVSSEAPVHLLGSSTLALPSTRGAVHFVRLWHDSQERKLQVFLGTDSVRPQLEVEFDIAASLPGLDMGCAYMGFCLVPLDHRHQVVNKTMEGSRGHQLQNSEVPHAARDRPVSIVSWRHRSRTPNSGVNSKWLDEPNPGSALWFSCLELAFKAPWPIPIIITRDCLAQYNQLFRLLLAFRLAHLELQRTDLRASRRLPDRRPWILKAQLSHFVLQVLLYFQQDVIEVGYHKLSSTIASSQDFDEVVTAHEQFLASVSASCFLRSPELHAALTNTLRLASAFCRIRFTDDKVPAHPSPASAESDLISRSAVAAARNVELRRLQAEFTTTVALVLKMMSSMHKEGVHMQVSQLLLRLDYNGYFSGDMDK